VAGLLEVESAPQAHRADAVARLDGRSRGGKERAFGPTRQKPRDSFPASMTSFSARARPRKEAGGQAGTRQALRARAGRGKKKKKRKKKKKKKTGKKRQNQDLGRRDQPGQGVGR